MRCDLLGQLLEIPGLDISQYDSRSLCTLLLYGSPLSNVFANRMLQYPFLKKQNDLTECSYPIFFLSLYFIFLAK